MTGKSVEIRIFEQDGSVVQTIAEPVDGDAGSGTILLRDIDSDGRDDLLLSLSSSGGHGVNSDWAVWREPQGATQFQRVQGQLFGEEFWFAGDGDTAAYASGGGWAVRFSRIENNTFAPVASVGRDASPAGRPPAPGEPICGLLDSQDLAHYGFTKEAAEQKFCALALPQLRARGLSDYSR